MFWLQRKCSQALVQIFVAGIGDFGEHSRAPALLNTPLVQSVCKCVKIICWGANTMKRELIFGSTYNFMETQIIVPFCFWTENLPDFLDNVLFFNYTHNEPAYHLHTYTLVFKGKEDSFIKHNFTYPVDIWKINSSWHFSGEIKLGGGGGFYIEQMLTTYEEFCL